ncbi:hypothetical protein F4W67_11180 [Pseudomonas caricapapayae]|nr:hypothetical protein F4W67_11180 [Pseudomonas caricapapayae]
MSAMGCEAALKQATLIVSDAPYAPVLLPVSGSSRTSPLLQKPGGCGQAERRTIPTLRDTASARRAWEQTCPRWAAKRP